MEDVFDSLVLLQVPIQIENVQCSCFSLEFFLTTCTFAWAGAFDHERALVNRVLVAGSDELYELMMEFFCDVESSNTYSRSGGLVIPYWPTKKPYNFS